MHIDNLRICRRCHDILFMQGEKFFGNYLAICCQYIRGSDYAIRGGLLGDGGEVIRKLEHQNFIVTSEESPWMLVVKPRGHKVLDNDIHYFCAKKHT